MIETASKDNKQSVPHASSTVSTVHVANLATPVPTKKKNKRLMLALFGVLFVLALGGGFFAYLNSTSQPQNQITNVPESFAWTPTIIGKCTEGRIIMHAEAVPYVVNLDLSLNDSETTPAVAYLSEGATNVIDKSFAWNFSRPVQNDDAIKWHAVVRYTPAGAQSPTSEEHSGTIVIKDCVDATAEPTEEPTASPSATARAAAALTATATPTASPTARPTGSPATGGVDATATPTASPTPAPTRTATPAPTSVSQATAQPQTTAVNNATDDTLPKAGVGGYVFILLGGISLLISAGFAFAKKKYY